MRSIIYLALLGLVIAGAIWGVQRLRLAPRPALPPSQPHPTEAPGDLEERASLAYGRDRGPGMLRLTPSQLIFTADSGRVTAVERMDIIGVSVTKDLPDRTIAQPLLAVATADEVYFLAVSSAPQWEQRLT